MTTKTYEQAIELVGKMEKQFFNLYSSLQAQGWPEESQSLLDHQESKIHGACQIISAIYDRSYDEVRHDTLAVVIGEKVA